MYKDRYLDLGILDDDKNDKQEEEYHANDYFIIYKFFRLWLGGLFLEFY